MILFFEPYFEEKPWAGDNLKNMYDCPENTGEAWIISGYKGKSSVVKNGIYKGRTLRDLWITNPSLFGNFPDKDFPILIKLIDAKEDLSIQVHPDDEYAIKKHNQLGKLECWYILPSTKATEIVHGIKANNRAELKEIIDKNVLEDYLIKRKIEVDDLVVVEPGTIHAMLKDTFALEVQETSDLTYRLFDYNRIPKRELHIEDSLNVINYNYKTNPIHPFRFENTYKNSFFNYHKLIINGNVTYENKGFEIFYVISGECILDGTQIKKGDTFILTDTNNKFVACGNAELIAIVPKPKDKERLKMRKIALITGIIGQDGSYLADFLLSKNYEVHGMIQNYNQINHSSISHLTSNKEIMNDRFFLHLGDMTDSSNINRILEKVRADEIYHLASQSHVDVSFELPEYTTEVNSLGTLRMLDAIKNSGMKTKFFNLSTCLLYSTDIIPQTEETPFDPKSPYAISKLFAHYMVKNYRENYGIYAVNGILFSHDSPRREPTFVSKKIINGLKNIIAGNQETIELGNIDAYREWGHAKEYSEAIWLMLQQEKPEDFIISVGIGYTVREFIEKAFLKHDIKIIWQGSGLDEVGIDEKTKKIRIKISKDFFRIRDHGKLIGDSTKFKNKTSWSPSITIDELIEEMIESKY